MGVVEAETGSILSLHFEKRPGLSSRAKRSLEKASRELKQDKLPVAEYWRQAAEVLHPFVTPEAQGQLDKLQEDVENINNPESDGFKKYIGAIEEILRPFGVSEKEAAAEEEEDKGRKRTRSTPAKAEAKKPRIKEENGADGMDIDKPQDAVAATQPANLPVPMEADSQDDFQGQAGSADAEAAGDARNLCQYCKVDLSDENILMAPPAREDATGEVEALFSDEVRTEAETYEDSNQVRLTEFCIYDKENHLVPFFTGLLEGDTPLYFSGYVKPIYLDASDVEGGVWVKDAGPILEWWNVVGYGENEDVVIGFSTDLSDYYLLAPAAPYKAIYDELKYKLEAAKFITVYINDNMDAQYEDLTAALEEHELLKMSEEGLVKHGTFICRHIEDYDEGDPQAPALLQTECIKTLIGLSGYVPLRKKRAPKKKRERVRIVKPEQEFVKTTTTPLVRRVFEDFFRNQIQDVSEKGGKTERCERCENCMRMDCGMCSSCLDMPKFMGTGKTKLSCKMRKCTANAKKATKKDLAEEKKLKDEAEKLQKQREKAEEELQWVGKPYATKDGVKYYYMAKLDGRELRVGDVVSVKSKDDYVWLALVTLLYQKGNDKMYHAVWFDYGPSTILAEAADRNSIFLSAECGNENINSIITKCNAVYGVREVSENDEDHLAEDRGNEAFYFKQSYNKETGHFQDPNPEIMALLTNKANPTTECPCCVIKEKQETEAKAMVLGEPIKTQSGIHHFNECRKDGVVYAVGDSALVLPSAYQLKCKKKEQAKVKKENRDDPILYPERYRRTPGNSIKGSYKNCPPTYRVARIVAVSAKKGKESEISLKVRAFYRPEDTHLSTEKAGESDINLLYLSEDEFEITFADVEGKCEVFYSEEGLPLKFTDGETFYFNQIYDPTSQSFKAVGKKEQTPKYDREEVPFEPLPALEVFVGCGGLAEGFFQAGFTKTKWAIEFVKPAADAFKLNHPDAEVLVVDCNTVLAQCMEGKTTNAQGRSLPQKGQVKVLVGGPPCQGYSGMNRFSSGEYSKFKNSLVTTYLSYLDFFRPDYFLLENVRNFFSFKNNAVLKLVLRSIVDMGYNVGFGVLQAGNYGVPQSRRRAFIFATAPGIPLPHFPEPTHQFAKSEGLTVTVGGNQYCTNIRRKDHNPFRAITVRDAMSDLPPIPSGAANTRMDYNPKATTGYQRQMRSFLPDKEQKTVTDHVCKNLNELMLARIERVPREEGADWRDLPNEEVKVNGRVIAKKLRYTHNDDKGGKGKGVCPCAEGKACHPQYKQEDCLIPWCLPHTGNRHNNWAGLYGRLSWDGYFSTTVTNPEPLGKQGRVVHPEQNRVVSVRECARSQGFGDHIKFSGALGDKHRQVGNAVPPPLAAAIAREFKKAAMKASTNENTVAMDTNGEEEDASAAKGKASKKQQKKK